MNCQVSLFITFKYLFIYPHCDMRFRKKEQKVLPVTDMFFFYHFYGRFLSHIYMCK